MVDPINPESDDDDLLKDLDAGEINGNGPADSSRPLPKKVELDIDDFLEEEIEDEPPPAAEEKPPPPVKEEPKTDKKPVEEPHKRFSRKKLILLGSSGLVLLAVIAGAVFFLLKDKEPPPDNTPPPVNMIELKAFLVNFPPPNDAFILKLELSIKFPNQLVLQDFSNNRLIQRDRIYRMVQSLGPTVMNAWKANKEMEALEIELANARKGDPLVRKELEEKLKYAREQAQKNQAVMKKTLEGEVVHIINKTLRAGLIDHLEIKRMEMV